MAQAVLFAEPCQAPLIRESASAASPLPPGKALGILLAASDRELRKACEALPNPAADADMCALMHPLRSFLNHLERPEPARELIAGCLNHLLDAPPKKAGQQPRAVRLLLAAAAAPRAWPTACTALGHTLDAGDKRLKLGCGLVLREVLVAHLRALEFDPRVPRERDTVHAEPSQQSAASLHKVLETLMPLTEILLSVAERDGMVDEANTRCDPLPTRLTTLAADCCIAGYIAVGRLVLLPPAHPSHNPAVVTTGTGGGSGITVLAASNDDGAEDEADSLGGEEKDARADKRSSSGGEEDVQESARQQLWQALPRMERLLRLLRQWYGGRKVIGFDHKKRLHDHKMRHHTSITCATQTQKYTHPLPPSSRSFPLISTVYSDICICPCVYVYTCTRMYILFALHRPRW